MERVETAIDPAAGYTSLFSIGEDGAVKWDPTGQRVFDSPDAQEGGDVACVRDGKVSITRLKPTFQPANR